MMDDGQKATPTSHSLDRPHASIVHNVSFFPPFSNFTIELLNIYRTKMKVV